METRHRRLALAGLLVLGLCASGLAVAEEDYVGAETCEVCHEEVVRGFRMTAHAVAPNWDAAAACESCHGPGGQHAEGEVEAIVRFRELPPLEASQSCLSCHRRQQRQFTGRHAVHTLADVACIDCHNPHSTAETLLPERGVALCGQCHQNIVAQFDLPRSHPLPRNGIACEGCHEPHASTSLRRESAEGNATCNSCHFDKAGPFLYAHDVALVEGCSSCHTVHGAPNRHLLNHERQINLCYQCHAATQTPTFHNAQRFLNEKCTACHTAIHGSNTNPFFLEE